MSYVRRTLGKSETVLFGTGYHWLYWFGVCLLAAPFVYVLLRGIPGYTGGDVFLLLIFLFPLCYAIYLAVHGYALEIAVTSDRFVKKAGLISIKTEEVSLDKIEEVVVEESILGRIFGYGSLKVHGTGAGAIQVSLVRDPVQLRRQIQTAREQLKSKGE
jgi:hypothetical protein